MHASQAEAREGLQPATRNDPGTDHRGGPGRRSGPPLLILGHDVQARGACLLNRRAMLLWPRRDRRALARCRCDPWRIATYVARRTSLPPEPVEAMLVSGGQ